jgi:hypothetical protein
VNGYFFLCDFAQVILGKLYVSGGGWSRVGRVAGSDPLDVYLAGKIFVPWNEANRTNRLIVSLADGDGRAVVSGDQLLPVQVEADLEVGRPPGMPEGTPLEVPLVIPFKGLDLGGGRYSWKVTLGTETLADVTFDVVTINLQTG